MEQQFKQTQENLKSSKEKYQKILDEALTIQKEIKATGATPAHEKRLKEIASSLTSGINFSNIFKR